MEDETRQALGRLDEWVRGAVAALENRVRYFAEMHEAEQKRAGRARDQIYNEMDAAIAQLNLLLGDVATMAKRIDQIEARMSPEKTQHKRIYAAVQAATAAFSEVLFELLPPDREPLKAKFSQALGDLFAEVIGGATVMAAGAVVGVDARVTEVVTRVEQLEQKQVGGDASA